MSKVKQPAPSNIMTQGRFSRLKVVSGEILCPGDTDYTNIQVIKTKNSPYKFGNNCIFGSNIKFPACTKFGSGCTFGNSCYFGNFSRIGSRSVLGKDCGFSSSCYVSDQCMFGEKCWFEDYCSIGSENIFGELCEFYRTNLGNDNKFNNYCLFKGCDIGKESYFSVGCCLDFCFVEKRQVVGNHVYVVDGLSDFYLCGVPVQNTILIYFGGWSGTLGQFKKMVNRQKPPSRLRDRKKSSWDKEEMLLAIQMFEHNWKREKDANP